MRAIIKRRALATALVLAHVWTGVACKDEGTNDDDENVDHMDDESEADDGGGRARDSGATSGDATVDSDGGDDDMNGSANTGSGATSGTTDAGAGGGGTSASGDAGAGSDAMSGSPDANTGSGDASASADAGTDSGGMGSEPLPELAWTPRGTRTTWNGFSFLVPQGMTAAAPTNELFEMTRRADSGRICNFILAHPIDATGDLAAQAVATMTEFFAALDTQLSSRAHDADLFAHRVLGFTARGWDYVELTAELQPNGQPSMGRGRLMLVSLGATVVPIFGLATDNLGCIRFDYERNAGEPDGPETDWQTLYYSLEFPSTTAQPQALRPLMIGKWSDSVAGALVGEIYGANGRFASDSSYATERMISMTELERTTTTWSGGGRYALEGETLARFPTGRAAEANLFRVIRRYRSAGLRPSEPNPQDELHQMKWSASASRPYELIMLRDAP